MNKKKSPGSIRGFSFCEYTGLSRILKVDQGGIRTPRLSVLYSRELLLYPELFYY